MQRVSDYLSQWQWRRKVDNSGRISLYNHNDRVNRAYAHQQVWVQFDATSGNWVVPDATGQEVGRCRSLAINPTPITQLHLHRSVAKHRCSNPP